MYKRLKLLFMKVESVGITMRWNGPQIEVTMAQSSSRCVSFFSHQRRLRFAKKYPALTIITVICWSISCSSGESGKRENADWTLLRELLIYEQPPPRSEQRSCSRTKYSAWPQIEKSTPGFSKASFFSEKKKRIQGKNMAQKKPGSVAKNNL